MAIKRRNKTREPERIDYDEQIKRFAIRKIKQEIEEAKDSVINPWGDRLRSAPEDKQLKIKNLQFIAVSKIVKRSFKEFSGIPRVKKFIYKNYARELRYSRDEWFPLDWMSKDKKISEVLDQYPMIVKFLNYIFNRNRRLTTKQRNEMAKLTDSITDSEKYNDHDYAVFITDKDFFKKASKKLKVSEILLKKYLTAFRKAGFVKLLGQVCTGKAGRSPYLYADGYYSPFEDKFRKISFVINSPEIKEGLRNFKKFFS